MFNFDVRYFATLDGLEIVDIFCMRFVFVSVRLFSFLFCLFSSLLLFVWIFRRQVGGNKQYSKYYTFRKTYVRIFFHKRLFSIYYVYLKMCILVRLYTASCVVKPTSCTTNAFLKVFEISLSCLNIFIYFHITLCDMSIFSSFNQTTLSRTLLL